MNNNDQKQANKKFMDKTFKNRVRGRIGYTSSRSKTDVALFGSHGAGKAQYFDRKDVMG